jgi:flagellar biosynthesis/type III secretory pathway M-ring protein FliF/YscJ
MTKKLIILLIIFLIGFSFTADCSAIILENLPTTSDSPRPVPPEIISSMSHNFDINVYKAIHYASSTSDVVSANEISASGSNENASQNNPGAETTSSNNNFWYWLAIYALIIIFVLSLFFKRKKSE